MRTYFDRVDKYTCEGPDSDNSLAFRYYDRDTIVMANRYV